MLLLRSLARSFDWSGTAARREFALYLLAYATILAGCVYATLRIETGPIHRWTLPILAAAFFYPGWMALSARRLHDMGRSAWWLALRPVPLVGLLVLGAQLLAPTRRNTPGRFAGRTRYAMAALLSLGVALVLASRILWQLFYMPSGSMKPTLLVNDLVVVARPFHYTPRRGDIVAFRNAATGQDHLKRILGLPGDSVQMQDGRLVLNGTPVPLAPKGIFQEFYEPQGPARIPPACRNAPVGMGGICEADLLTETLPEGPTHDILDTGPGPLDSTGVYKVPQGSYFVLGDNRDNSSDSRVPLSAGGPGFVPADHIIGPVRRVILSSAGPTLWQVWRWRPDRFLRGVE